jgi:DNA-binding transcriptional LysR family regulator
MDARDLGLLLTLDALLQEGQVTRAADRLGLSVPATSHALARLRTRLGDPLLVRSGRTMALTPRAESLRPLVRTLVEDARRVLATGATFEPHALDRAFTIFATDHALLVLGPAIDRLVRVEAPGVSLRYLPSIVDDWKLVRDGTADLSICLPGLFPPEFRTAPLLTERFTCVVRDRHPRATAAMPLDAWLALDHIVVSPLGKPSGVDQVLAARGLSRRIRLVVPYFAAALHLVASSDDVLTVSASAVRAWSAPGLRVFDPPVDLPTYPVNLLWHPRLDQDPANRWLRDLVLRAARIVSVEARAQRTRARPSDRRR